MVMKFTQRGQKDTKLIQTVRTLTVCIDIRTLDSLSIPWNISKLLYIDKIQPKGEHVVRGMEPSCGVNYNSTTDQNQETRSLHPCWCPWDCFGIGAIRLCPLLHLGGGRPGCTWRHCLLPQRTPHMSDPAVKDTAPKKARTFDFCHVSCIVLHGQVCHIQTCSFNTGKNYRVTNAHTHTHSHTHRHRMSQCPNPSSLKCGKLPKATNTTIHTKALALQSVHWAPSSWGQSFVYMLCELKVKYTKATQLKFHAQHQHK